jgi:hypothetical protein
MSKKNLTEIVSSMANDAAADAPVTLRDFFAATSLICLFIEDGAHDEKAMEHCHREPYTQLAYNLADLMLKSRRRPAGLPAGEDE